MRANNISKNNHLKQCYIVSTIITAAIILITAIIISNMDITHINGELGTSYSFGERVWYNNHTIGFFPLPDNHPADIDYFAEKYGATVVTSENASTPIDGSYTNASYIVFNEPYSLEKLQHISLALMNSGLVDKSFITRYRTCSYFSRVDDRVELFSFITKILIVLTAVICIFSFTSYRKGFLKNRFYIIATKLIVITVYACAVFSIFK